MDTITGAGHGGIKVGDIVSFSHVGGVTGGRWRRLRQLRVLFTRPRPTIRRKATPSTTSWMPPGTLVAPQFLRPKPKTCREARDIMLREDRPPAQRIRGRWRAGALAWRLWEIGPLAPVKASARHRRDMLLHRVHTRSGRYDDVPF